VLSFAGLDQAAADKLERAGTRAPVFPRSAPREIVDSENEFGRFRGARQRVGLRDRFTLEVYQAVETQVAEAFVSEDTGRGEDALRLFQAQASAASDHPGQQPVHTELDGDVLIVRSAGADGSLLEIKVTPQ
jgi:hypothetical protein